MGENKDRIPELELMLRRLIEDAHKIIRTGYRSREQATLYAEAEELLKK